MNNKKNYLFIIFALLISACFSNQQNLKDLLKNNDFLVSEYGETYGFLKQDVILHTPYGKMTAAALDRENGYAFDFSFYEKTNVPSQFWPRTEKVLKIDGVTITISKTTTVFEDSEYLLHASIEFHDNYKLKMCYSKDDVKYCDIIIPEGSVLHFNKEERLESFVIYSNWTFNGKEYNEGDSFFINNGIVSPRE